jgi:hypothetical protein
MKTCSKCGVEKPLTDFHKNTQNKVDGRRARCIDCYNESERQRYRKSKENDPINHCIDRMANNILGRTNPKVAEKSYPAYFEKGIKCLIGTNRKEVKEFLETNFYEEIAEFIKKGLTPSVDRIDVKKHYEEGNLRIIEREENTRISAIENNKKRKKKVKSISEDGSELFFESVAEAARHYGIERRNVSYLANNAGFSTKKIRFEFI